MKKLLAFLLLFYSLSSAAQGWQWAKSGGATNDSRNMSRLESVYDMTTDKWGNVYAISLTNMYQIEVDGHSLGTEIGDENAVVASWDCNGNYRWAKFIGSYSGWRPSAIGVDTLGGVYVSGNFYSNNSFGYFRIGADTNFGNTYKDIVLIKLDSTGAYQWAKLPQPDTTLHNQATIVDMDVEADGTVHLLAGLDPGAYANGQFVIPPMGGIGFDLYIVKYNRLGQYSGLIQPQIHLLTGMGLNALGFRYEGRHRKYYFNSALVYDSNAISFNGHIPNRVCYVASYDAQGQYLWYKESNGGAGTCRRPAFDAQGNIYIAGGAVPGTSFLGYTFTNPISTGRSSFPFVAKIDSNGTLAWAKNGWVGGTPSDASGLAYANGAVGISGSYFATLYFDSLRVNPGQANAGMDIFLARFDAATGAVLGLDSAKSPLGFYEDPTAMANDRKGNFFIGGWLEGSLSFGSHTVTSRGGSSDWFISKFGSANCGCAAPPPPPAFTAAVPLSGGVASFSYSGSTAGIDSLVWLFGDGKKQTVTANFMAAVQHNYSRGGNYMACLVVYTACGNNQSCKPLQVTMGVEAVALDKPLLTIFPNPANETVQIGYRTAAGSSSAIEVYDVLGRRVAFRLLPANATDSWNLDVSSYASGVYRVVLRQDGRVVLHQSLSVRY